MLHSSSHPTLDYTGTEERLADNKPALRHYLGIFDPVTGEMQLIETPKVTIRGTVRARQADTEASAHTVAKKVSQLWHNLTASCANSFRPMRNRGLRLERHLARAKPRRHFTISRKTQSGGLVVPTWTLASWLS